MGHVLAACAMGALASGIVVGYISTKLFRNTFMIIIGCNVGAVVGALIVYYIIIKLVSAGV